MDIDNNAHLEEQQVQVKISNNQIETLIAKVDEIEKILNHCKHFINPNNEILSELLELFNSIKKHSDNIKEMIMKNSSTSPSSSSSSQISIEETDFVDDVSQKNEIENDINIQINKLDEMFSTLKTNLTDE